MTDAAQAAAPVAAAADTSAPQSTIVPAIQAAAQAATPEAEPAWLKGRLERAERAAEERAIKALGFGSADDAKKAIEAARAATESQKTEEQRLREQVAQLDPLKTRLAERDAVLGEFAKTELAALTEKHRAVVVDLAGDDPAAQLRAIAKMRANGLLAPVASEPAKHAPLPAPATTAAPPVAPSAATPGNPNHAAEYDRLQALNPFRAAQYLAANRAAILAARTAGKPAA